MKSTELHSRDRIAHLLAFLICAAAMACLASCRTDNMNGAKLHLDCLKEQFPPQLTVVISNLTARETRIWKQENSWGWGNLLVELQEKNGGQTVVVKRKTRDWTKNGPGFIAIPPHQDRRLELNLADGWWEIPDGANLLNRSYRVRVRLNVKSSPEAEKLNIFIGQINSDWK